MNEDKTKIAEGNTEVNKEDSNIVPQSKWGKFNNYMNKNFVVIMLTAFCLFFAAIITYSMILPDICSFLGYKFLQHNKTNAAKVCLEFARDLRASQIAAHEYDCAEIEYDLAKLNKEYSEKYIAMMEMAASHDSGEAAYELAKYYFTIKKRSTGAYYLQQAAYSGIEEAQYEWAIYLRVFGTESEKMDARMMLKNITGHTAKQVANKLEDPAHNTVWVRKSTMMEFHIDLFNEIRSEATTWQEVAKNPMLKNIGLIELKKTSDQCALGVKFLENHIRMNYTGYEAIQLIETFAEIIKAKSEVTAEQLKVNNYTGINNHLNVPGTDFVFKNFDISMLINPNMPYKKWGIYWLEQAAANGCSTAKDLLAAWEKGANKVVEAAYDNPGMTYLEIAAGTAEEKNSKNVKTQK